MYSATTDSGAPPHDPAEYDGDQKCPAIRARLTRPVNSCRSQYADTPLSLLTSVATGSFGG